jgi:BMC domain.
MDVRMIKSPSEGTMDILRHRITNGTNTKLDHVDAVGLVQGKMIEMICAADIAEKAVGVTVTDVKGNCFSNMIMIAIFGDTAAVDAAIQEIKSKLEEGKLC